MNLFMRAFYFTISPYTRMRFQQKSTQVGAFFNLCYSIDESNLQYDYHISLIHP
jgi:hypothetical protein